MASDDVFDARIAEMLTRDDSPVYDTEPDTTHWKKLCLRLEIRASGLMNYCHDGGWGRFLLDKAPMITNRSFI
ncbi:MAG: hypothetical protein J0I82_02545, partial [Spirosoma sp.]|uniref:hypothetical protein n=1 Tax=Spirosoma sp. TaxID=1899569 RepID=UPI0015D4F12E|nr:hypothetical protein [Spirosoma sp.]MBN8820876.1 hypothetical protein [Spirosoma sp.]